MSAYENYQQVSAIYDMKRRPLGINIIRRTLKAHYGQAVGDIRLVDIGCGTGNHSKELLEAGVGKVTLVDASKGMLKKAEQKLAKYVKENRVDIFEHKMPEKLPLSDQSVDVCMANVTLHHQLPKPQSLQDEVDYTNVTRTLAEMARIVRKGGYVVGSWFSRVQLCNGYWMWRLVGETRMKKSTYIGIDMDVLEEFLGEAGLSDIEFYVPVLETILKPEVFFDYDQIMDKDWRKGDSSWSLLSEDDVNYALDRYQTMKNAGKLEAFLKECERFRKLYGQGYVFIARKN